MTEGETVNAPHWAEPLEFRVGRLERAALTTIVARRWRFQAAFNLLASTAILAAVLREYGLL